MRALRSAAGAGRSGWLRLRWTLSVAALVVGVSAVLASAAVQVGPPVRLVRFPYIGATELSSSMEPTLHCASAADGYCQGRSPDFLLIEESGARSIRRGAIIAFHIPAAARRDCEGAFGFGTKRVIGLPGDRIQEHRGIVWVNGRQLAEPYVPSRERDHQSGTWTVPANSYFVMGDDRVISCDSRKWGAVRAAAVIGLVKTIYRIGAGTDPVGPPIVHVTFPYHTIVVTSSAMEPTLHCGRLRYGRSCGAHRSDLLVEEASGAQGVRRGDIVWFRLPTAAARFCGNGDALERIIGLPGERVSENRGAIAINGTPLSQPYVPMSLRDHHSGHWRVPPHSYFVMADYRPQSCDSRYWGSVRASAILGRIVEILRPSS